MDIYKLKFTVLQQEIFRLLCLEAGRSFTSRSLARKLGVSPTAIAKSLPLLKSEKLIVAEKDAESGRMAIEFDFKNARAVWMKRIENLRAIYDSGLVDFLLMKFPKAKKIVLIGNYSLGTDGFDSDINILLDSDSKKISLSKFEGILGKKIVLKFSKKREEGIVIFDGGEK